jgi:hypothetical protein
MAVCKVLLGNPAAVVPKTPRITEVLPLLYLRAPSYDLVDQHRPVGAAGVIGVGGSRNYGEHGSYLPDRRADRA